MIELETKEQVDSFYEEALRKLSVVNENFEKAAELLRFIFLRGVRYEDENGNEQLSYGIDPENPKFCDELHAADTIYKKGQRLIRYAFSPDAIGCLIIWYSKFRGITSSEIIELGKDSNSEASATVISKLEKIKQDFTDLINSNNISLLSDFYFEVFKKFKNESNLIIKCGTVNGFVKNWPLLTQWVGAIGAMQLSFEDDNHFSTPEQLELVQRISAKVKTVYGDDVELRDIVACLKTIDDAYLDIYEAAGNKTVFQSYLQAEENERITYLEKFARAIRTFNFLANTSFVSEIYGDTIKYPSRQMGIASVVLTYAGELPSGSDLLVSEMKYLAGDNAYPALYDMSIPLDFKYEDEDKSAVSTSISGKDAARCLPTEMYEEILSSEESILDLVLRKSEENIPMTYPEIAVYFSDANIDYDDEKKKAVRLFFAMEPSFRMSRLPDDLKYVLEQFCLSQVGVSAEEYVSGTKLTLNYIRGAYIPHIRLIKDGKRKDIVNIEFNRQYIKMIDSRFTSLELFDSDSSFEFDELKKAFKEIVSKVPTYPSGQEQLFKSQLVIILEKAWAYIRSLNLDEGNECVTGREQVKYILTQRIKIFASETLAQMAKAEEALRSVKK